MADLRCPRCGAGRTENFRWCRKCGMDFHHPPKDVVPDPGVRAAARPQRPERSVVVDAPRVDVRQVDDRANMARNARDAIDVRCLGTIGGLVGAFLGFLVLGYIGGLAGGAGVLLGLIGIPVGWWIGVRTALGWLAR